MLSDKLGNTDISYEVIEAYNNNNLVQNNIRFKLNYNENIGSNFLYTNGFNGMYVTNVKEQLNYGDLYLDTYKDTNIEKNYIDIKSCYINSYYDSYFYNKYTLAIDLEYFECYENGDFKYNNGKLIPYKQSNTDNSLGWLYHLENCDTLLCVSKNNYKIFLIENFQKLRSFLIDLDINGYITNNRKTNNLYTRKYAYLFTVTYSKDNRDENGNVCKDKVLKRTRTIYLNLEATEYFNKIGCNVSSYDYRII